MLSIIILLGRLPLCSFVFPIHLSPVSENISHSVLILIKTVGKLCKLMKARQKVKIFYISGTFLLDLLICYAEYLSSNNNMQRN